MDDLWKLCFPYCPPCISDPLTVSSGGEVVSMLSRMPFSVRGYRAVYIYGVATRPDHRGRGLAGSLIMEALKTPGADIAALVPERPELAGFYGRFGFAPRGRLPRDGRLLMIKHLRGAAPDEEVCAGLAGLIQIFEDSPED